MACASRALLSHTRPTFSQRQVATLSSQAHSKHTSPVLSFVGNRELGAVANSNNWANAEPMVNGPRISIRQNWTPSKTIWMRLRGLEVRHETAYLAAVGHRCIRDAGGGRDGASDIRGVPNRTSCRSGHLPPRRHDARHTARMGQAHESLLKKAEVADRIILVHDQALLRALESFEAGVTFARRFKWIDPVSDGHAVLKAL